jgi:8-oxo-dGTP pyrophosphatase MutT (NUDIX family)
MGLQGMRPHHSHLPRGLDVAAVVERERIERLRRRLGERNRLALEAGRWIQAGVLVPLLTRPSGVEVLFTRRTDTVLTHKGQISFPGGAQEPGDGSPVAAALRESYEEIGLDPAAVDVLGQLDDVPTVVSGFVITPIVGTLGIDPATLTPAPLEVKNLLVVPLRRLLEPGVHRTEDRVADGLHFTVHYFTVDDDIIWGATGRILDQFLEIWQAL